MTKSNLINRMCEAYKVPTGRSEQIVNAIFAAIEQALERGERVEIRGFGSFEVRDYQGYVGRNPRTGSTVDVKPKRLAFFKVGKELKDRVQKAAVLERGGPAAETQTGNAASSSSTPSSSTPSSSTPSSAVPASGAASARKPSLVPPKHVSVGASNA